MGPHGAIRVSEDPCCLDYRITAMTNAHILYSLHQAQRFVRYFRVHWKRTQMPCQP